MKVEKWIPYDDDDGIDISAGGLGGGFNGFKVLGGVFVHIEGMRWRDYISGLHKDIWPYSEAIRVEVVKNGLRICGDQHQESPTGVPFFSDGTKGLFSYRAWGDIMAAIWSEEEDKGYSYMDFYMERD